MYHLKYPWSTLKEQFYILWKRYVFYISHTAKIRSFRNKTLWNAVPHCSGVSCSQFYCFRSTVRCMFLFLCLCSCWTWSRMLLCGIPSEALDHRLIPLSCHTDQNIQYDLTWPRLAPRCSSQQQTNIRVLGDITSAIVMRFFLSFFYCTYQCWFVFLV